MLTFPAATFAAGTKVVVTPNSPTISEGASQTYTVQLAQPIIVGDMTRNYVHLNITSSDPSRISVTPNPVEYLPTDWWQQRSFTVTALPNTNYGDSGTVTITVTADSGAAYYDLYTVNVSLTITDTTPAPPITQVANSSADAVASTTQPQLVNSGVSITATSLTAVTMLLVALIVRLLPRRPPVTL